MIKDKPLFEFAFFLFLMLILITRIYIFFGVNLQYIDHDQPLMWLGARDYSNGLFYVPRFYGQAYNTFLEGLVAVPLLWMNIPVYIAVPLATHLLFIVPVCFTAFYLRRKKMYAHALLVFSVVLCMPVGYDILTGIPRGFVTGILFTAFFILSVIEPANLRFAALNMICAVFGYFANPNSLLVSAPILLYLLIHNYRNRSFYLAAALAILPAIPLYLIFDRFYKVHPEYIVHGIDNRFSWQHFRDNISNLPDSFVHISFFTEEQPFFTCFLLLAVAPLFWRFSRPAFWSYSLMLLLILVTRFSEKSTDGSSWPFFSNSRLYLGVPFVATLLMCCVPLKTRAFVPALLVMVVSFNILKFARMSGSIAFHLDKSHWNRIPMASLPDIMTVVPFYSKVCKMENANDLMVSHTFWLSNHIVYGGPALYKDYPNTYRSYFERRRHVSLRAAAEIPERMLLISARSDLDKIMETNGFHLKKMDDYGMFLITENTLTVQEIAHRMWTAEERK